MICRNTHIYLVLPFDQETHYFLCIIAQYIRNRIFSSIFLPSININIPPPLKKKKEKYNLFCLTFYFGSHFLYLSTCIKHQSMAFRCYRKIRENFFLFWYCCVSTWISPKWVAWWIGSLMDHPTLDKDEIIRMHICMDSNSIKIVISKGHVECFITLCYFCCWLVLR